MQMDIINFRKRYQEICNQAPHGLKSDTRILGEVQALCTEVIDDYEQLVHNVLGYYPEAFTFDNQPEIGEDPFKD